MPDSDWFQLLKCDYFQLFFTSFDSMQNFCNQHFSLFLCMLLTKQLFEKLIGNKYNYSFCLTNCSKPKETLAPDSIVLFCF